MKTRQSTIIHIQLLFVFLIFIGVNCCAQVKSTNATTSIITTKVIELHCHKFKQTATLKIPVVSAAYPKLKAALCDTTLFFGSTLDSVAKNFTGEGFGITSFDYEITFLNKDVVSIILSYETMGAYPDNSQTWLTLNIHTGKPYPITNEITPSGMRWAFNSYKRLMRNRILADKNDFGVDDKWAFNSLNEAVDSIKISDIANKYVFTKTGIRFSIEQILPHVVRDHEPDRDWEVKYSALKTFKAPNAIILK